jgi:Protein of unknown function (DUF2971)
MDPRVSALLAKHIARTGMSARHAEVLRKLAARAKPPPILYRYRAPHGRTLSEIANQQIFAASPDALNDPFECMAPVKWTRDSLARHFFEVFAPERGLSRAEAEKEFEKISIESLSQSLNSGLAQNRRDSGIICLSAIPDSIRMWSYYAQQHEGVCLGFDTAAGPFIAAMKVKYQNPDKPLDIADVLVRDPSELADHVTLRKAAEWEFEQEYRIPIGPIGDRPRLMPFHPSALIEVRFGARLKDDFRTRLMAAIARLPNRPKLVQMTCDCEKFILIEEVISP